MSDDAPKHRPFGGTSGLLQLREFLDGAGAAALCQTPPFSLVATFLCSGRNLERFTMMVSISDWGASR
jgi:hypothetical protein